MTKEIDFYFDFISPYSYLAHQKIKSIKNVNFNYKPVLVGGLHNLQGITAPAFIKPKLKHMMSDCDLIAKKDKSNFIWNSNFPINSLNIMRGYLFINVENRDLYLNVMFDAYWKYNLNISNEEIQNALNNWFWPGRMQLMKKNFFYDVAHNLNGISAMVSDMIKIYNKKPAGVLVLKNDKINSDLINLFNDGT